MSDKPRTALEIALEKLANEPTAPSESAVPEQPPTCNECRFAIFQDYGYSNWTVEGTEFFCAIKQHPADGFDRWYGDDGRLNYAAECRMFRAGEPISIDVDREDLPTEGEARMIYDLWDGEPIKPPTYPGGR